ncbi:MAG: hypothetical protein QXU54_02790, partial [Candidatus Micrarchaeia archaeon]
NAFLWLCGGMFAVSLISAIRKERELSRIKEKIAELYLNDRETVGKALFDLYEESGDGLRHELRAISAKAKSAN